MNLPPEVADIAPGVIGSGVAAVISKFQDRDQPWWVLIAKAIGGAALAYYGTPPVARYFGWADAQGFIRLILGLLAMAAIIKLWETFAAIQGRAIFSIFIEWLRKLAGLPPRNGGPHA
jgi:uncharacterized membrane protein HdeD (DUF308 family)